MLLSDKILGNRLRFTVFLMNYATIEASSKEDPIIFLYLLFFSTVNGYNTCKSDFAIEANKILFFPENYNPTGKIMRN